MAAIYHEALRAEGPARPATSADRTAPRRDDAASTPTSTSDFMWARAAARHVPHPDVPRRRRQVRLRRARPIDARVAPAVLRQRAAAAQLHRRRRIDADSPAIRLVGMPKVDCLVDGTLQPRRRAAGARARSGAADRALRPDLVAGVVAEHDGRRRCFERARPLPVNVIVKLHDRSRDLRDRYSGGVDWAARLAAVARAQARAPSRRGTTSRRTSSRRT